jgi:hypothetical protein
MALDFSNAGTVWVGISQVTIANGLAHVDPVNVSFPAGLFTATPVVSLTAQMDSSNTNAVKVNTIRTAAHSGTGGVDATGFSYVVRSDAAQSPAFQVTVQIIAIQPG